MAHNFRTQGVIIILLAYFIPGQSHAFLATDAESNRISSQFFAPYEVNSFMLKRTSGDDPSSEINISMRYFFKSQSGDNIATLNGFNPFFSYTGKYDFYWWPMRDTRYSGPVVSRYQNPAIHFRYRFSDNSFFRAGDWGDIGFEHISNGQALTAANNKTAILNAYQSNNNAVMDSISRVGATLVMTLEDRKMIGSSSDLTIKWYAYRSGQEADTFGAGSPIAA